MGAERQVGPIGFGGAFAVAMPASVAYTVIWFATMPFGSSEELDPFLQVFVFILSVFAVVLFGPLVPWLVIAAVDEASSKRTRLVRAVPCGAAVAVSISLLTLLVPIGTIIALGGPTTALLTGALWGVLVFAARMLVGRFVEEDEEEGPPLPGARVVEPGSEDTAHA